MAAKKKTAIQRLDELIKKANNISDGYGHVGVSLSALQLIVEIETAKDENAANKMYNHPFYNHLQQSSNDLHSMYPIRKMALINALEAYKETLSW